MLKKIFKNIQEKSREKKFRLFMETFNPTKKTKILDIGPGQGTFLEKLYPFKQNITCIEISQRNIDKFKKNNPGIKIIKGDARGMKFKDSSFDIIFSNAVIEHVGDFEKQKDFADEIRRVGKSFFITTPNKFFPYEPHYRLPLFQFLPKIIQKWLSNVFPLGNYPKGCWEDINLVSSSGLKKLFPKSKIIRQRISIYPETLIAIKN